MKALGRSWRGRKYSGTELPVFLEAKNLNPFISKELAAVLSPMEFRTTRGTNGEGFKKEAPVERFETLKIRGKSIKEDRVMTYDLLKDQFIQTKHIAKMVGKSRAINSASMYTAIDEAYNQLKGKLNTAASAEIE